MNQPFVNDQNNIANLYQQMLNEDMTAGGVYGGSDGAASFSEIGGGNNAQSVYGGTSGEINLTKTGHYGDDEDARNPFGLGITTRKGRLRSKKGKKRIKKS